MISLPPSFLCAARAHAALRIVVLAGIATLSAASSRAQVPPIGYTATVTALPATAQAPIALAGSSAAYYDGTRLLLDHGAGGVRTLLAPPAPQSFAAFTLAFGAHALVFGDGLDLWFVPLDGVSSPRRLATLPFHYDAVLLDAQTVLVSAKLGGFGAPDNDVLAVDLATGAIDRIASLPGFSGPLAIDRAGDVYYGLPRAAGGADVVKFTAAQIASVRGVGELTELDASIVHAGLPSAASLAIDADDDIFVSDFVTPAVFEIRRSAGSAATLASRWLDYPGGPSAGALRFVDAPDATALEPFQPANGKSLSIAESDFAGIVQLRRVLPLRATTIATPSASAPIPPGVVTLRTSTGLLGGGGAAYLLSLSGGSGGPVLSLPGIEQPLAIDIDLAGLLITADAPLDAVGDAVLSFAHGGFGLPVDIYAQLLFVESGSLTAGTAAPIRLTLAP